MVESTLKQLDVWFNEPSQGRDRPKLLSKLATLELCGWIEGEFDRLALLVEDNLLKDRKWVTDNVISKTSGFDYESHWRRMLCCLVGEVFARRIEQKMDADFPGDRDVLKSRLGDLWRIRCEFAHTHVTAPVIAQQRFNAPSWSINQYRVIKKQLDHLETSMLAVLNSI